MKRYFYSLLGLLALVVVLIGFGNTYLLPMYRGAYNGRLALHVHGAVFIVWILLGIVQPLLIQKHKVDVHRKLGVYGFVLGGLMVFIGLYIGITSARIHVAEGGGLIVKQFLLVPITDMILFGFFVLLAYLKRNDAQAHKRLIILATLSVLPAAFGRLFALLTWWTGNVAIDLMLALLLMEITLYLGIAFDAITRKKVHPVYVWGGMAVILVHAAREFLQKSDAWVGVAEWLTK